MEDANELNSILRSLLVSNPRKTSASYLKKDFYENYGKEFPFAKFGFRSFVDYLRSIPDVVQVVGGGFSDPTILPVTSEKSSHVESLIMRQRVDTKAKGSRRGPPPRRPPAVPYKYFPEKKELQSLLSMPPITKPAFVEPRSQRLSTTQTNCTQFTDYKMNNSNSSSASNLQCSPLPEFIYQHVRRLVNNNPGMTFYEMSAIFWDDRFKGALLTAGIGNVADLLKRCTNFITINGNLIFPKYCERERPRVSNLAFSPIRPAGGEQNFDSDDDCDMEFSDDFDNNLEHNGVADNDYKKDNLRISPSDNAAAEVVDDEDELSTKVIENFRKLLKNNPDGISCPQLPELYHKEFGVSLDFQDWGYPSIIQMASRLPKVFHYVRESSCSDWKLYDARLKSISTLNGCAKEQTNLLDQKWIPQSVLENVRKLLLQHPSGILSSVFLEKYAEKYNCILNLRGLGFDSLIAFLNAIEDIVHLREGHGKLFLLPKKPIRLEEDLPKPTVPALPEFQKLIPQLYPKEVCGQNFELSPNVIDMDKGRPLLMQVRVTEVATPSCFWIVPESHWDQLEEMMTDLNDFYTKHNKDNERYVMPDSTILKDQLCIAPYGIENLWHRAKILHYFSIDDEVKVEYVDYGTIAMVKRSVIRFLHKDFAVLPKLAIQAKLYGIQSISPRWPKECNVQMLDLVNERSLIAEVITCKNEASGVEIVLYEAGPDGVKHRIINDHFVKTRVAKHIKDDDNVGSLNIGSSPIPNSPQIDDSELVQQKYNPTNGEVDDLTSPSGGGASNLQYQTHYQLEDTLCMSTPVRPPPGFTEKDKALCNAYPGIHPVFAGNMAGFFKPRDSSSLPIESFSSGLHNGQQTQPSSSAYQNSIYNYQLLQFLTYIKNSTQSNVADVTRPSESGVLESPNLTLSIPNTTQSIPLIEVSQTPPHCLTPGQSPDHLQSIGSSSNNSETRDAPVQFSEKSLTNSPVELVKGEYRASTNQIYSQDDCNRKKGIFSPVEIDHKYITENMSKFACESVESSAPMFSPSSNSKVLSDSSKCIGYEQRSNIKCNLPKASLISESERKTPDCWEDIFSDDCDTRLVGGYLSEQSLPKEKELISKSVDIAAQHINGIKVKSGKNYVKRNNGFLIPKPGHKELFQVNRVTTCLKDIKIFDELEEDIKIIDKPERNTKIVNVTDTKKCLFKEIKIGTKTLHVMKIDGTVMASTEEVIRTFTSFSVRNSVMKILDSKMISFPFSDIHRNKNEELFKEVDKTELLTVHNKGPNSFIKMNVLPLEVVPQLLSVLNVKGSIISDFKKALSDCKDDKEW